MLTVDRDAKYVIATLRIVDDAAAAIVGLVYDTAGLSVEFKLPGETAWTSIDLSAGTLGTWSAGGFIADTDGDGWYQIGLPASAIAAGVTTRLRIKTAGNGYRYGFVAAIASGQSLTGPNAIKVVITDSGTDAAIEAATVRFYRTGGASGSEPTDADGEALFGLVSAKWTVVIDAAGYESKTETLEVSGDATVPYSLDSITLSPPGTGGLCRVRIPVREANVAAKAAQVTAQLVGENKKVGNDLLSRAVTRGESDATGYVDLLLPQGLTYRIVGTHGGHQFLDLEYLVPDLADAYLADAIQ